MTDEERKLEIEARAMRRACDLYELRLREPQKFRNGEALQRIAWESGLLLPLSTRVENEIHTRWVRSGRPRHPTPEEVSSIRTRLGTQTTNIPKILPPAALTASNDLLDIGIETVLLRCVEVPDRAPLDSDASFGADFVRLAQAVFGERKRPAVVDQDGKYIAWLSTNAPGPVREDVALYLTSTDKWQWCTVGDVADVVVGKKIG